MTRLTKEKGKKVLAEAHARGLIYTGHFKELCRQIRAAEMAAKTGEKK